MIYLALGIVRAILKFHDYNIKYLLSSVKDYYKLVLILRIYSPLVKEGYTVYNSDIEIILDYYYNINL